MGKAGSLKGYGDGEDLVRLQKMDLIGIGVLTPVGRDARVVVENPDAFYPQPSNVSRPATPYEGLLLHDSLLTGIGLKKLW